MFARYSMLCGPLVTVLALHTGCVEARFPPTDAGDAATEGGSGTGDAGLGDGASEPQPADGSATNSGEAGPSGTEGGAGPLDAGPAQLEAGDGTLRPIGPCRDNASILGAECRGIVNCTDRGLCDRTNNLCCVGPLQSMCEPRSTCTGTLTEIACDGNEDCVPGTVCCQGALALACVAPARCTEENRTCHSDADCTNNRCANGIPAPSPLVGITYFDGIGFCNGH